MGEVAFLMLSVFAEMERILTRERAAHARAVAAAQGRQIGRPKAHSDNQIEHAQLLRARGESLSQIVKKTGIPKSSLRRYLTAPTP
jgi:DNA invertase Pin-like site-specific DNA recombinase